MDLNDDFHQQGELAEEELNRSARAIWGFRALGVVVALLVWLLLGGSEGLSPDLALELARMTVAGAGALAIDADEDPAVLRENVTSPGGTTAAGLRVLMDAQDGLRPLMTRTVAAAAERGRELGRNGK